MSGGGVEEIYDLGFTTLVLALAKPPSMSRGRVYDMREEKVGLDTQCNARVFSTKSIT
jgi:hypothetical protein